MGLGGSKDEKVHIQNTIIKGKYLKPLPNANVPTIGARDFERKRQALMDAKWMSDNYVRELGVINNKLLKDSETIKTQQASVDAKLQAALRSQRVLKAKVDQMA